MSRKAKVTFYYKAVQDDEIDLEVGSVITNIINKDTGWCEGEVNGKRGMFPSNFVEFIPNGVEKASVQPEAHPAVAGKKGKVTFRYEKENDDELTLEVDDIVDILGEDEEGWWIGRLWNRIGVFPSNFVEIIEDTAHLEPMLEEKPGAPQTSKREPTVSYEEAQTADVEEKRNSAMLQSKKLPGGGVGFGNLVNKDMLAKKLKKVHLDDKKEERNESTVTEAEKVTPNKGPKSAKTRPAPPVPAAPQSKKLSELALVICDYDPQDQDELMIRVGNIITVINKDVADNEGWWEGELNGRVGMFPNNFVELLPSDDAVAPTKDKPTDLPPTSKKGIPVLPVSSEGPKPPVSQDKRASLLAAEENKETRAHQDVHTPEKPAGSKPPVKKEKPNLPPKKPLHSVPKKPEKKFAEEKGSSAAKTKVGGESNETNEVKLRESSHLRKKSKEENTSSRDPVTLQPEIKTEDFADGGISFDSIPETQTLNHLTANRAKNPQKRPPSKDGRLTDSARLSGNLDDQLIGAEQVSHEAQKQAPGRPKEPPKEPAWKREAREARESKVPPATLPKEDAIEKRNSLRELPVSASPASKGQTVSSIPSADVEKLYKQISELRDLITNMEKKHNEAVKKLEEKFNREIESLTNDFDEERKQNAALKVEIDRLKRRVAKLEE